MPQQCCPCPLPRPLSGVCVVRGHFAFASCGILRTSCRLSRHAKTCPRSSPTPPSPPLPPLLVSASFPAGEGGTKFCPHTRTSHCSCFAFQPAATCGKSGCISLFLLSFLTCHIQHPQRQQQLRQQHTQPTWPGNPHQET